MFILDGSNEMILPGYSEWGVIPFRWLCLTVGAQRAR